MLAASSYTALGLGVGTGAPGFQTERSPMGFDSLDLDFPA